MGQQQRQELGLVNELSTEACLHFGSSEKELVTAWQVGRYTFPSMVLSACPLTSLVLAAHLAKLAIYLFPKKKSPSDSKFPIFFWVFCVDMALVMQWVGHVALCLI
jgi:hypothetical protein